MIKIFDLTAPLLSIDHIISFDICIDKVAKSLNNSLDPQFSSSTTRYMNIGLHRREGGGETANQDTQVGVEIKEYGSSDIFSNNICGTIWLYCIVNFH